MDSSDIPGGYQPPRVKVTPPPVPPENDAVIRGVLETSGASISVAMAEGATVPASTEGGGDVDGGEVGDDRAMTGSGAMARRSEEEARSRSEVVGSSEERATEAHGGGSGNGEEERAPEASPVRQP